jgi:hypothetical protein
LGDVAEELEGAGPREIRSQQPLVGLGPLAVEDDAEQLGSLGPRRPLPGRASAGARVPQRLMCPPGPVEMDGQRRIVGRSPGRKRLGDPSVKRPPAAERESGVRGLAVEVVTKANFIALAIDECGKGPPGAVVPEACVAERLGQHLPRCRPPGDGDLPQQGPIARIEAVDAGGDDALDAGRQFCDACVEGRNQLADE